MVDAINLEDRRINLKARFGLLYVLGQLGATEREIRCQDTYGPVADLFGLTNAERNLTIREKSGQGEDEPWWPNTVRWARNELRKKRLLTDSNRGYWQLNERGQQMYMQLKDKYEASEKTFEKFVEDFVGEQRSS